MQLFQMRSHGLESLHKGLCQALIGSLGVLLVTFIDDLFRQQHAMQIPENLDQKVCRIMACWALFMVSGNDFAYL